MARKKESDGAPAPKEPASWPADKVERRSVASLVPYARNPRTHSPDQVDQLAASIREWGSLQAGANAEPNQNLFGAIRIRARRPIPLDDPLVGALVEKPTHQTRRADVKVNAIRVNLCPDEDGAGKIVLRLGRQILPTS